MKGYFNYEIVIVSVVQCKTNMTGIEQNTKKKHLPFIYDNLIYVSIINRWERRASSIYCAAIRDYPNGKKNGIEHLYHTVLTNPLNDYIINGKDKFSGGRRRLHEQIVDFSKECIFKLKIILLDDLEVKTVLQASDIFRQGTQVEKKIEQ